MGTSEVDAALAANPAQVGARVLALPEDQWFDRKSAATAPKDLAVALVAFANAEGGIAIVGASNGQVHGLAAVRKKINELRQASVNFTVHRRYGCTSTRSSASTTTGRPTSCSPCTSMSVSASTS